MINMENTKSEILNPKQYQNSNNENPKRYDLEERTLQFARNCRSLVKNLPKTQANVEDGKQLIRASGSVGANYIEANESLSKKDFFMRIKICRKEAKESRFWLQLIETSSLQLSDIRNQLIAESVELTKIFGSIVTNSRSCHLENSDFEN